MREKKQGNLQSSCSYFTRKLTLSWVVAKFVKFSCFFVDIEKGALRVYGHLWQ